jgi:hypothetical protein
MEAAQTDDVLYAGELEIRPRDGLVLAAGRALTLSVREFGLLVALVQRAGRIVSRDVLYTLVWESELRDGDRSIDVYVHKLRVKLETALPAWRSSTPMWASDIASRPRLHTSFTTRPHRDNRMWSLPRQPARDNKIKECT